MSCTNEKLTTLIQGSGSPQEALAAIGTCDPVVAMALAFRADPDGAAVMMSDLLRRMNIAIPLLVISTALVTYGLCKMK